jgi:hypothetical protein
VKQDHHLPAIFENLKRLLDAICTPFGINSLHLPFSVFLTFSCALVILEATPILLVDQSALKATQVVA